MGLLDLFAPSFRAEDGQAPPGPLDDFWYGDPGLESDSGISISPDAALRISTVWKCVNWWRQMYGTLPHKLFERKTVMGRPSAIEAFDNPLYELIHTAPNPTMTAAYFHGMIPVDQKLHGTFYAAIQRGPDGKPKYLWRLRPELVTTKVENKKLLYEVAGDDGRRVPFYPDEILALPAISKDGRTGLSAVKANHNVLAWNRATVRYGAQFFKNASRPSGIISATNPVPPDAKKEIIANLRASGKEAGKLVFINGATTFEKMTLDQDEAQFILTCNMQEEDICGDFDVFPHEIGITRNSNNSITEQLTINTVTRKLAPFCVQVEQEFNLQLLSDVPSEYDGATERSRLFFQTELKALLRGDTAAQTAHIKAMRDLGIYDGNDCSEYLGNSAFEGGDIRVINGAYVPLDMLREIAKNRKPGDVGAPNGPGGPPPTDNQSSAGAAPVVPVFAGIVARARKCYAPLFADAAGRVSSRKKPADREKYAHLAFSPILPSLADALGVEVTDEWRERYLVALSQRATAWESDSAASDELNRACEELIEHGKMAEYFEGRNRDV